MLSDFGSVFGSGLRFIFDSVSVRFGALKTENVNAPTTLMANPSLNFGDYSTTLAAVTVFNRLPNPSNFFIL